MRETKEKSKKNENNQKRMVIVAATVGVSQYYNQNHTTENMQSVNNAVRNNPL